MFTRVLLCASPLNCCPIFPTALRWHWHLSLSKLKVLGKVIENMKTVGCWYKTYDLASHYVGQNFSAAQKRYWPRGFYNRVLSMIALCVKIERIGSCSISPRPVTFRIEHPRHGAFETLFDFYKSCKTFFTHACTHALQYVGKLVIICMMKNNNLSKYCWHKDCLYLQLPEFKYFSSLWATLHVPGNARDVTS